ncbi:MAG TPA: DUF4388 domain-containing protein [Anaerolineae bacterium]|nr:DUF4388 domain-containing protein [Anaerolineae bacterium]
MGLKGNLRDFSITQLLNLINLARKTGLLVIQGPNEKAEVYFREGRLAYAGISGEDNSLAGILYRGGKLTRAQYNVLRQRASNLSDKELGLLLVNAGYLTQQDVLDALKEHYVAVVRRLFTWAEGLFSFELQAPSPKGKILTRVSLENLIIEGSRQMREWERLQDEIPSLEMALKFTERPGTNLRNLNLSVEEWRVISLVNPKNSLRQIMRATKMNELEIRRIVYGLLQAGIVELVRPEGYAPPKPIKPALADVKPEERRSLVNRLIERIRNL